MCTHWCRKLWCGNGCFIVVFIAYALLADEVHGEGLCLASWVCGTHESGVSSLQRRKSSWLSHRIQEEIFRGNVRLTWQHATIMKIKAEIMYVDLVLEKAIFHLYN